MSPNVTLTHSSAPLLLEVGRAQGSSGENQAGRGTLLTSDRLLAGDWPAGTRLGGIMGGIREGLSAGRAASVPPLTVGQWHETGLRGMHLISLQQDYLQARTEAENGVK